VEARRTGAQAIAGVAREKAVPQVRLDGARHAGARHGAFVVDGHVAEFGGPARRAAKDAVLVDDCAPHARAERDHNKRRKGPARAVVRRPQPRRARVVFDQHRIVEAEAFLQRVAQVDRLPARHVGRLRHGRALPVDRARRADADAGDALRRRVAGKLPDDASDPVDDVLRSLVGLGGQSKLFA